MILENNERILQNLDALLLKNIKAVEPQLQSDEYIVEEARSGQKTLKIHLNGQSTYIHSKYDPVNESIQWLNEYEQNIELHDHIFFYGIGLGYHIEHLMKQYPQKTFTLYEPNAKIFYQYICHSDLMQLPLNQLKHLYVDFIPQMSAVHVPDFINKMNGKVMIVVHPAYQRLFKEQTDQFIEGFSTLVRSKMFSLNTSFEYQKVWIVNSLHNFLKVIETPNILREKKPLFSGKPVILVSAGPSLTEEFENLKYIKENKLAYIFAVGSANRALINNGIKPDAVTSYDPTLINYTVFQEIIEQNITDIPLIFGTSVNYKTIQLYPGPMLHMFISQDTLSPVYLGQQLAENYEILMDAPSIAVVTLELLIKLGAGPIILAGQNFAYRNEEYFAQGIDYNYRPATVTEQERSDVVMVESVDGGQVATGKGHISARVQMETYLNHLPEGMKIINTTRGGAKITGTEFLTLDKVIELYLKDAVVEDNWFVSPRTLYDWKYLKQQAEFMEQEHDHLAELIDSLVKSLKKMEVLSSTRSSGKLDKYFMKFDNHVAKMINNLYYRVFIRPMTRTTFEALENIATDLRRETDIYKKSAIVLEKYGQLIYQTKEVYMSMLNLFQSMHRAIMMTVDSELGAVNDPVTNEQSVTNESTFSTKG